MFTLTIRINLKKEGRFSIIQCFLVVCLFYSISNTGESSNVGWLVIWGLWHINLAKISSISKDSIWHECTV